MRVENGRTWFESRKRLYQIMSIPNPDSGKKSSPAQSVERASKALKRGSRARESEVEIVPADQPIESLLNSLQARKEAIQTLYDCLKAERTYYDLYSKSMVTEPDSSTRCSAARTLLAYDVGEPVKRQQIIVHQVDSMDDLKAKLATNPALCESLLKVIAEAKGAK